MTSYYHRLIAEDAPGYDSEEVECYMRLKLHTLDHLTRDAFRTEVQEACACIDADPRLASRLARTYGPTTMLPPKG